MKPCTVCGSTTSLRPDGAGICYGCQKLNTAPDLLRRPWTRSRIEPLVETSPMVSGR